MSPGKFPGRVKCRDSEADLGLRTVVSRAVVVHDFNLSIQEAGRWICNFEASLLYSMSFRTARGTQKNPFSKEKKKVLGVGQTVVTSISCELGHLEPKDGALDQVPPFLDGGD